MRQYIWNSSKKNKTNININKNKDKRHKHQLKENKKQHFNRPLTETTDDEKIQIQKEDFIVPNFSYLTREI